MRSLSQAVIKSSRKGQSLVEMALATALLLLLLGGVVDLGRAFFTYMALRDAAQEGAVYGAINPAATIDIQNHVVNSSDMTVYLITNEDVEVDIIGEACTGNAIRVNVTYPDFQIAMPFVGTVIGRQTVAISASVTDTILSPSCP